MESHAGNNPPACSVVMAAVPAINGDGLELRSKFSRLLTGVNFGSLRRLLFNKDILKSVLFFIKVFNDANIN